MNLLHSFLKEELNISDHLISDISSYYDHQNFTKNDFLIKEGRRCNQMLFVEKGYFRFYNYSENKTITHWIFGKGQMITDMASFFLNQPAKWNIQALSDAQVYSINIKNHTLMSKNVSEWNYYEKMFIIKLLSALENRVHMLLSMKTEERYKYLLETDVDMFAQLPLQYVASMLRMTPETLSRLRRKVL